LLPVLFLVIATSIKLAGIVRTDVAQRLSLFIPVISAFTLFSEKADTIKIVAISVGFIALICLVPWKQKRAVRRKSSYSWFYLVIIFIGMGVIDVLLKQVAKTSNLPSSLFVVFILAFAVSFIGLMYQVSTKKMRFSWPHIPIGWILGIANFGNILFFIKAHQSLASRPSYVFSSMDIGVIIAGAVVGLVIFREKLSLLNFIGILLGVLAIVINSFHDPLTHLFATSF
jgi:drug/metabolite transporter (DMT)-like permease